MSWHLPWPGRRDTDDTRWLVVDVETTGLDAARDHLLAIAGIAVRMDGPRPMAVPADSFEIVLRHDAGSVDKHNILLHGIGVGAQRAGVDPATALEAFEHWAGHSPMVAFHAAFDQTMILRHMARILGRKLSNPWLDLAQVAPALQPAERARSLDEWMRVHGIRCAVRHQAAADAQATAELLLKLAPLARAQGTACGDFRGWQRLADQQRWLQRR